jgi:transcription antitermination factor NusG
MYALPSIFVPLDRVVITSGPFHGFAATVVNVPTPGKLELTIDGFNESSQFVVREADVEPCKDYEKPTLE